MKYTLCENSELFNGFCATMSTQCSVNTAQYCRETSMDSVQCCSLDTTQYSPKSLQ
jgi:hypothetical protein